MTQFAFGYGFAFFCAFIVIVADYVIKLAADAGHTVTSTHVFLGVALYGIAAVLWFYSMQHVTLVQAGVAYSMLSLIALAIMGALWFDEPLRLRECAGLGCALLSMVLLTRTT